jgi:hypothetical protein
MSELAGYNTRMVVAPIAGGTAGTVTLPLFPAPFGGVTVKSAYAVAAGAVAANGSNYFTMTLHNGGTAGTATAALGTAGGTVGWSAGTPKTFDLNANADELAAGEWLVAKYAVTGTVVAPGDVVVSLQLVGGKG